VDVAPHKEIPFVLLIAGMWVVSKLIGNMGLSLSFPTLAFLNEIWIFGLFGYF
jgi:hypothetical protein